MKAKNETNNEDGCLQKISWRDYVGYSEKQRLCADLAFSRRNARVLYGGAGFGGKSQLLRWITLELNAVLANAGVHRPYGALACKVGEDLRKRHSMRLEVDYADIGEITDSNKYGQVFHFKDRRLGGFYLIHLENPARYRSAEFSYILGDEITEWSREDFGVLLYSLRSKFNPPIAPFIGASNPDGPGHAWVKKLWIDRDFSGDDSSFNPDDFIYVPALPEDNPVWNDDMMASQFAGLPAAVRHARLTGDWSVVVNARFPDFKRETHVFSMKERFPFGMPAKWDIYRAVDYGYGAPFCCLWAARCPASGDIYVYRELYQSKTYAWRQAELIMEYTSPVENVVFTIADPSMHHRHAGEYGMAELNIADIYAKQGVHLVKGWNNRVQGWACVENYIAHTSSHPKLYVEQGCHNLIRQLESAQIDPRSPMLSKRGDIDPRQEDHAIDALRYLLATLDYGFDDSLMRIPSPEDSDDIKLAFMEHSRRAMAKDLYSQEMKKFIRRLRN